MASLSYVTTNSGPLSDIKASIPTDESVGAMLFDISGFSSPFNGFPLLYNNFGNGQVQCIHNMDEAELLGIGDNNFLNGLLYYHVSEFYKFLETNQELYIALADCSDDWNAIWRIQQDTVGKLFHIGVWTHQPIWEYSNSTLTFSPLISDLQSEAEELCGVVEEVSYSPIPLSIILFGNTNDIANDTISYKQLPDASGMNCPKVSVILGQENNARIHGIQELNPLHAPVGLLGLTMACLAKCGAEESIASTGSCNLNSNEQLISPELSLNDVSIPVNDINYIQMNLLSSKGYILPIAYDTIEAGWFFSSDQTLSSGDYASLANNRIMHKCRRIVCTALLPYVNSHHVFDASTRNISVTSMSVISNSICSSMDMLMRNRKGFDQVKYRYIDFENNDKVLDNDTIFVKFRVMPVNYSSFIEESVTTDTIEE